MLFSSVNNIFVRYKQLLLIKMALNRSKQLEFVCFDFFISLLGVGSLWHTLEVLKCLRAAPRKYQLDLEIAKKSNFSKLAQNEALRALVTKVLF